MNVTRQFEYLLTKSQNRHFMEKRDKVATYFTQYTKPGDVSEHDYRDATSVGIGRMAFTSQGGLMHQEFYKPGTERVTTFKKFTIGITIPEEIFDDMASNGRVRRDNVKLLTKFSQDAAESAVWTQETVCADFALRGTSTTKTSTWVGAGRDNVALAGTHTTAKGGVVWVNLQAPQLLTQQAIEEAIQMLNNQPDETGRPQAAVGDVIIMVSRYHSFRLPEILGSDGQVDTNNNNPNTLKMRKGGYKVIVNPYLPDTWKGWLVLDSKNHELTHFLKQKPKMSKMTDVYTGNRIFRVMMRFGIDFFTARGVVLCEGL